MDVGTNDNFLDHADEDAVGAELVVIGPAAKQAGLCIGEPRRPVAIDLPAAR